MFKLLALVPLAEICGQQTHTSLEKVPQPHFSPSQSSLWPGFPFSIPQMSISFHVWSRRQRLQSISEVAGGCPVPPPDSATEVWWDELKGVSAPSAFTLP